MAADALLGAVGAHDHGHGIPADNTLDAALGLAVPGEGRLFVGGNRIDVGCGQREGDENALLLGVDLQPRQQRLNALGAAGLEFVVEGFNPLADFDIFGERLAAIWVIGRSIVDIFQRQLRLVCVSELMLGPFLS